MSSSLFTTSQPQGLDADIAIRAVLAGANAGADDGTTAALADLLQTAQLVATTEGSQPGAFSAEVDPSIAALRGLIFGLLTPHDRQALRRGAFAAALAGAHDEAAALVAVAVAVLVADLCRGFEMDDCLTRCRQTLLEEAPTALLDALHPLADETELAIPDGVISMLQFAVTACQRYPEVTLLLSSVPSDAGVAVILAAALAALAGGETQLALPESVAGVVTQLAAAARNRA